MPSSRPLFSTVWIRFHAAGSSRASLAAHMGGAVAERLEAGGIRDLGTLRLSLALMACGMPIPRGSHSTLAGADGRAYFYRPRDIAPFLHQHFGAPDVVAGAASDHGWGGSRGIVLLSSSVSMDGGALTLWNGRNGATPVALAAARSAQFWLLP